MSEVVYKTEKLSKDYVAGRGTVKALQEVDLEVKRGDFVAIMGHSGSGKTTLLNILGCLDKPSGGSVSFGGASISGMRESEMNNVRKNKIGFVFQGFNLLPYLDARENVELAMEGTGKSAAERGSRASELLTLVGLSERHGHRPQQLSAGEQQRVAIARALANDPSVILADEPTGNLDEETKHEITNLLVKLNLDSGTTIVLVTHDSRVARQTDRVITFAKGRIKSDGKGNLARRKEALADRRAPPGPAAN